MNEIMLINTIMIRICTKLRGKIMKIDLKVVQIFCFRVYEQLLNPFYEFLIRTRILSDCLIDCTSVDGGWLCISGTAVVEMKP